MWFWVTIQSFLKFLTIISTLETSLTRSLFYVELYLISKCRLKSSSKKNAQIHLVPAVFLVSAGLERSVRKCYKRNVGHDIWLTQLLFGSQCVEAGLGDDLTEQLQLHVVVGRLHVCLVVNLNATIVVHLVPLLINVPATWEEQKKGCRLLQYHQSGNANTFT